MAKMAPDEPHALYRFFGAGGTLLYIGITNSIPTRLKRHNGEKAWWLGVAYVTVEHYPNRGAVLEAEKRAIRAEKPLYNDQHNDDSGPRHWGEDTRVVERELDLIPVCMGCGNGLTEDWENGLLHVCHYEVFKAQKAWEEWNAAYRGPTLTLTNLRDMPDLVPWQVHCGACNPHTDPESGSLCSGCYAIDTEECKSWRALLQWTSHLADKDWLSATNWFDFIGAIARGNSNAGFVTEADYMAGVVD